MAKGILNYSNIITSICTAITSGTFLFLWNMNGTIIRHTEEIKRIEMSFRETDKAIQDNAAIAHKEASVRIEKLEAEVQKIYLEIERLKVKGYSYGK